MPDVVDAAQQGIVVLLATLVALLITAVVGLFWLVIRELRSRAERAEKLTDVANTLLDKAVEGFQIALDELRTVKRTKR